jgi:hypothetical protein
VTDNQDAFVSEIDASLSVARAKLALIKAKGNLPASESRESAPQSTRQQLDALFARADVLADDIEKRVNRWPAGTPEGKGGQFAPGNVAGGAGSLFTSRAGVSVPSLPQSVISRWSETHPSARRIRSRLNTLRVLALADDIDTIRTLTTSRSNNYERTLDDYRVAVIAAFDARASAQQAAAANRPAPVAPTITGSNMSNSALVSAQRHVQRLQQIVQDHPDPVERLRNYQIGNGSRTNGYLRQAQSYHAALVAHYSQGGEPRAAAAAAPPVQALDDALRATAAEGRRASLAREAQGSTQDPALFRPDGSPRWTRSGRSQNDFRDSNRAAVAANRAALRAEAARQEGIARTRMANGQAPKPAMTNAQVAVSDLAANPRGLSKEQLGFIPRPNLPLGGTVQRNGFVYNGEVRPYVNANQERLANAYLSQSSSLQRRAREYQAGTWAPPVPLTAAQQAAQAKARQAQERQAQENIRRFAADEERRRAAIPPSFRSAATSGANITSAELRASSTSLKGSAFQSKENFTKFAKTLVSDYGGGVRFSVSGSVSGDSAVLRYSGNDGTSITRNFRKEADGSTSVYHAYFRAGGQGNGAGKRFFRTSMGEYIAAGVKHVDVTANIDVGGYAWARFGYLPKTKGAWQGLQQTLNSRLDREKSLGKISKEQHAQAARVINDRDPRALWKVADMVIGGRKLGKELLLGTNWSGRIDLSNKEQMRRFTAYVTKDD